MSTDSVVSNWEDNATSAGLGVSAVDLTITRAQDQREERK